MQTPCALDEVIATHLLSERPSRRPEHAQESRVVLELTQGLDTQPEDMFQRLAVAAIQLTGAESAGVSLLNGGAGRFVWPAVVGGLANYVGAGTPADFGPCGAVMDRNQTLLMRHPERYFAYLIPIRPPLEEVLLAPFYLDGKAVGTVWAVMHTEGRMFEAEDRRLLESVSSLAGLTYGVFLKSGTLAPHMAVQGTDRAD